MSGLYDLLQRQGYLSPQEDAASPQPEVPPPRRAHTDARHEDRLTHARDDRPTSRERSYRPLGRDADGTHPSCPPLGELEHLFATTIPRSWVKDIQRIAFFVTSQIDDENGSLNLVFSGLSRRVGTTTISSLIAHYLAAEMGHKRVLYMQYAPSVVPDEASCRVINVGQRDALRFFQGQVPLFNWIGVMPDTNISPPVASRWFREFIEAAKKAYAIIIADTPPFADEPGSYALARVMDGVVLVLASGESRYPAVNALVDELDDLGIQIVGAVLNRRRYAIPRWLLRLI